MSPEPPPEASLDVKWPCWMKEKGKMQDDKNPHWLPLPLQDKLLKVQRYNESDKQRCYTHLDVYEFDANKTCWRRRRDHS